MFDQVTIHGEAEHLPHQAEDQLGHPIDATGEEGVGYFSNVAFLHVGHSHLAQEWEHVLFKHSADFGSFVLAIDQVDFGPVLE
ncbi:hypothetical protein D9M71_819320 [compost metagenome]